MTDPHRDAVPVDPATAPTSQPTLNPAPTGYAAYSAPTPSPAPVAAPTDVFYAPPPGSFPDAAAPATAPVAGVSPAAFPSAAPPPAPLTTPLRSSHEPYQSYQNTVVYPSLPPTELPEDTSRSQRNRGGLAAAASRFPLGLAALVLIPIGVVGKSQPWITLALVVAALMVAWRYEPQKRTANLLTAVAALLVGMLITWPAEEAVTAATPLPVPTPTVVKSVTSTVTVSPTPTPAPSVPFPTYSDGNSTPYGSNPGAGSSQAYPTSQPYGQRPKKHRPAPPLDRVTTEEEDDTGPSYSSCEQVRSAGRAPIFRGQAGWSEALDPDGDGVACDGKKRDI